MNEDDDYASKDADVDVFVVLDKSYYQESGQASLLDKVKRVLKRTYPNTPEISRNGQAVTEHSATLGRCGTRLYPRRRRLLIPDSIWHAG